jgi:PAS domain S-box-containing protein
MKDRYKTKKQLIEELEILRHQLAEPKMTEANGKQVGKKLRESEEKYRNLVERANDGIAIGQDGIIRYVNPRLAHMAGYTIEELTGAPIFDFFFPEDRAKLIDRYRRRLAGEDVPTIYESALKYKDGSRIEVEINAGVISYNGKPADLVFFRDITERKRTEARAKHLKFVLLAIRGVNQLITQEKDRDRLIQGVCDKLIETRGYDNVWIALIDESGKVAATAEAGLGKSFLPLVEQLGRSEPPYCMRMALTKAGVLIIEDPFATCADCPLSNGYGGRSAMAIRLEHDGKIYGPYSEKWLKTSLSPFTA